MIQAHLGESILSSVVSLNTVDAMLMTLAQYKTSLLHIWLFFISKCELGFLRAPSGLRCGVYSCMNHVAIENGANFIVMWTRSAFNASTIMEGSSYPSNEVASG